MLSFISNWNTHYKDFISKQLTTFIAFFSECIFSCSNFVSFFHRQRRPMETRPCIWPPDGGTWTWSASWSTKRATCLFSSKWDFEANRNQL